MASDEEGRIKQGTIAQFMRKRTQLVGFEFGYWKHQQYVSEFLDNALDAIEEFQWRELNEGDSRIQFSLDQELSLENLSILQEARKDEVDQPLSKEAKLALMQEIGLSPAIPSETELIIQKDKEEESGEIVDKEELEIEEEVRRIIDDMNEIIKPVEPIVDIEPLVIIRLRESEAASFLTSELSQKNIMSYTFEIFDNGIGMHKGDLRKFGKYLASSKSLELKQTRGSQGFGAPSAFSDAQNTTGKPIIAVSKSKDSIYATVSEFFTTSKNEKKYLIRPTEVDSQFLHGTYIKLNYLNVKYVRGYVDTYIKETALMNPHITLIFIDPSGKEWIYRRLVSSFPKQPKYAKPHPSSTNIGDLQDLLTKSVNLTISAFLQDNFVRMSSKTAKEILKIAERNLQDTLSLLILKTGFVVKLKKKTDEINFCKFEKRVFGKSTKPRDKLLIYKVDSEELKNGYWENMDKYLQFDKNLDKLKKEIKKHQTRLEKSETKKDEKKIEKDIDTVIKKINSIYKEREKIKSSLEKIFSNTHGLIEAKKLKNRAELEDLVNEVQISKTKPSELTNEQFNALFHAFKSIKYMNPPTDTAIPVGDIVLESTLIKEIGLKISDNVDYFDDPTEELKTSIEILQSKIKKDKERLKSSLESETTLDNTVRDEDIKVFNSKILSSVDIKDQYHESGQFQQMIQKKITSSTEVLKDSYQEVFEYFTENYTRDDDFVNAETRPPTSGKGLAYVVEAALAYCNDPKKLDTPKRSRDVLSRFVNRTPKLRDSADCAITKAVQSVNWKNYKLDTYDNNLPKGPLKLIVNVSGPYVHLMFKSQSKNALADDEELLKEIKYCLEAIGRRLRVYINRKANIRKSEKRAGLIERYIPLFVQSAYNIVSQGNGKYKGKISEKELEKLMKDAIGVKLPSKPIEKKPAKLKEEEEEREFHKKVEIKWEGTEEKEEIPPKPLEPSQKILTEKTLRNWTINELREYCLENGIELPSKVRKQDIIKHVQDFYKTGKPEKVTPAIREEKAPLKVEPVKPGTVAEKRKQLQIAMGEVKPITTDKKEPTIRVQPTQPPLTQTHLPIITTDKITEALSDEWQPITSLIFKMKIKDMMDARFLQIKLKELERKGLVLGETKMGKKHWKLK
jgi:DNA topoisomerase VI B subunit